MEYSEKRKGDVFNVVGFIFSKDKILVIFPKHYKDLVELERLNQDHRETAEDIQLLFKVIKKYCESEKTFATAKKYLGYIENEMYDSDYPFKQFYEIYDYYRLYGLFREQDNQIKRNVPGKVSWSSTIRKSQKIISEGNLIFTPLYTVRKNYRQVFITECMAFVIDYTIDYFHNFLRMQKTGQAMGRFDFLGNIDYVVMRLREAQNEVFKDVHKKLIQNLIDFFEKYKKGSANSGNVHIKIRHYDMIWQTMIGKYLNRHFAGMNQNGDGILFDTISTKSIIPFEGKTYYMDSSPNRFYISLDHSAVIDDTLFIFDSKYYAKANSLNYKQFAYNEILRFYPPGLKQMFSVLLLPGHTRSAVHFELAPEFVGPREYGTKIIEQYIEPKEIMKDYLKEIN